MTQSRREFMQHGLAAATLLALGGRASAAADDMIYRTIPASGEQIPVIGLGTNRYGVGDDKAARKPLRAALQRFHELGGTLIDTAPMYRSSETVLGNLVSDLGIRDKLFIATKADEEPGGAATVQQMESSATKLRSPTFDLMQVHNLRGWQEALAAMRDWKEAGRIRYIGITTSRESQYKDFEMVMRQEPLDFIQINYSLEQRSAAERILPLAADSGIAVIINRGFGGGRIFDAVGDQPLPEWAAEIDCTSWAQFLLKYAISHPAATAAIPGMTKVRHVEDNMMAGRGRLPDAALRKRQEAFFDSL